jgi:hypothetical protein
MPETLLCPHCRGAVPAPAEPQPYGLDCPHCGGSIPADLNAIATEPRKLPAFSPLPDESAEMAEPRRRREWDDDGYQDDDRDRFGLRQELGGPGKAWVAVAMLGLFMLVETAEIAVEALYFNSLDANLRFATVDDPRVKQVQALETVLAAVGVVRLLLYLATAVTVVVWIHGAYKNLGAFRLRGLQFSPGWAVGYFFIPIVNLWRPMQVVQEIWRASDPETPHDPDAWRSAPTAALVGWWWAFWIISNISGNAAFRGGMGDNPTIESIKFATVMDIISAGTGILAGILLTFVILGITGRQQRRYDAMQGGAYEPDRAYDQGAGYDQF